VTALVQAATDDAAEAMHPGRTDNCFDFLRLVAAVSVVVQHSTTHLRAEFLWYRSGTGRWFLDGVVMFFIISGGMVYASAQKCHDRRRPWRDYFRNRALRIAPALYAYTFVALVFLLAARIIKVSTLGDPHLLAWFASSLGFVPVYNPTLFQDFGVGVLNGSLWTIPVEVSFYLAVPALVVLAARKGFATMIVAVAATSTCAATVYALFGGTGTEVLVGKFFGVSFLPWLGFFALGMVWARVWPRVPTHGSLAVAALLLYAGCAAWRQLADPGTAVIVTVVGALPLSYLVFWLGHRGPRILRRITDRLGDLSFGTYIWHMPMINILIWLGARRGPLRDTSLVLATIALSLSCAWISWRLVERPALALKRYSSRPGSPTHTDEGDA
jgi:peptidoglycan/LPS O-acetylase OafA/YrhL